MENLATTMVDASAGRGSNDGEWKPGQWIAVEAFLPLSWAVSGAVATPLDIDDVRTVRICRASRRVRRLPPPVPRRASELKRAEERKAAAIAVEAFHPSWDSAVVVRTEDLSASGALLRGGPAVPVGEAVMVTFRLPSEREVIGGFAEVVRRVPPRLGKHPRPAGLAVRFLELGPLDQLRIRDALRALPQPPKPRLPPPAAH
jgi:hypothetical protein